MPKFPVDAPKRRVLRALEQLGFQKVNEREHISMVRQNADGTRTYAANCVRAYRENQ